MSYPESDEVAGYQYRLAQARRLIRYCAFLNLDVKAVLEGRIEVDVDPICGEDGKIKPEPIDLNVAT